MLEIERLVHFKLILFCFLPFVVFGQSHPNLEIDSLLRIGIENIILQKYSQAVNVFSELDREFSNIPLGDIYLAATEITKSVDYKEELNENYVDSLIHLAKEKTERLLDLDEENIWNNYYEALIYGYSAYYNSLSGSIVSAFADGVLSLRSFQNCLEVDRHYHEAYIAIGTYNYWKSAQVKSLLWLPFVSDKREEGIELLEKAIQSFSYNKHLAAYSLIWIYIDYGKNEEAVEIALKMLEEYPESRYFKWGLARAYQNIDKEKAIRVYSEILESIRTLSNRNQYNDIVLMHKIAMLQSEVGKLEKALFLCNEILEFKFKFAEIKEKLNDRLHRTEELKELILEKMD